MSRPNPLALVLDLTRRLAEEFDMVPIPMVSSAVRSAVSAAEMFGDDLSASIDTVESIARQDLVALREATLEQAGVALAG